MTFACASLRVKVNVVGVEPSTMSVLGLATRADITGLTAPGTNRTLVVAWAAPNDARSVFDSATVPCTEAVNTPALLVYPVAGLKTVPGDAAPTSTARLTAWLGTRLPKSSRTVATSVPALMPSAVI